MKFSDIKVGDTVEYDFVFDGWRGSYRTKRGIVVQKRGLNLEVDEGGVSDWWYWPTIRHYNPRIVKAEN